MSCKTTCLPRTALRAGRNENQTFLKTAETSFFPSQSAKRTSWNTKGDGAEASVTTTITWDAVAIWGPFISKNSSFDLPSLRLSWCITYTKRKTLHFKYNIFITPCAENDIYVHFLITSLFNRVTKEKKTSLPTKTGH